MSRPERKRNQRIDADAVLARITQEGPATLLSLAEAAALVASRTMDSRDDERMARNRVRGQIRRSIESTSTIQNPPEDGSCVVCRPDGRIAIGELVRWAALKYPGRFDDLPRKPSVINFQYGERLNLSGRLDTLALPGSPEAKDSEIRRLHAQVRRLEEEIGSADARRRKELGSRFKKE